MSDKKWSEAKGIQKPTTFRHTGFKTNAEMLKYIKDNDLPMKNIMGFGYNKKDKHFFEYRMG